jgi:tRNA-specific adenosine deaminase 3
MAQVDPSYYMAQLQPVLHHDETREIEFVASYIANVSDPKKISAIIAYLAANFPLDSISHLKRIRKLQNPDTKVWTTDILIGLVSDVTSAPAQKQSYLTSNFGLILKSYQIPKHEPLMRRQYDAWSLVWPMVLKVHIPSTPEPSESFSPQELVQLANHMRSLIKVYKEAGNACLILDPNGEVMARSVASLQSPLSHCSVLAINDVAERQLEKSKDVVITHLKRTDVNEASESKPVEYLCTGGTAILVREPCIMCSMALLHSRIARVVYAIPNNEQGGLGSRFSIHCEYRLNHHFQVYRGLLAGEIELLSEQKDPEV